MADPELFKNRDTEIYREAEIVIPDDRHYRRFVFTLPEGTRIVLELDEDCVPSVYGVDHLTEDIEWGCPDIDEAGAGIYTMFPRGTRDRMSQL